MTGDQYMARIKNEAQYAMRMQLRVTSSSIPLLRYMRAQRCLAAWSSMDDQDVIKAFGMSLREISRHMSQMGFVWNVGTRLWVVAGNRTAPVNYPTLQEMQP